MCRATRWRRSPPSSASPRGPSRAAAPGEGLAWRSCWLTSAAAEIARLVRSEPAWSSAYTELAAADHRVREHLHAYGQDVLAEPMPAEVIARVDAALAGEAGSSERAGRSLRAGSSAASSGKV